MNPEEKKAYNRQYYLAHREQVKRNTRDYRKAHPDCRKGEKARYRARHGEKIRAAGRAYSASHKEERHAYHMINKERLNAISRAYHAKHRAVQNAKNAEHRRIHGDEIRRKEREKARANGHAKYKAWCKKNRAAYLALRARAYNRRRALKKSASIGTDRTAYLRFIADMRSRQRVPCYWCGKSTTPKRRHVDHIIPLAKGGPDDVHNLCCSCPHCNSSKQDKMPEEFSGQGVLKLG